MSLIRCSAGAAGLVTYAAVRSGGDALERVAATAATFPGELNIRTVSWDTLPGVEGAVAAAFDRMPPRSVVFIGSVADGAWVSWYVPVPQPPVPETG